MPKEMADLIVVRIELNAAGLDFEFVEGLFQIGVNTDRGVSFSRFFHCFPIKLKPRYRGRAESQKKPPGRGRILFRTVGPRIEVRRLVEAFDRFLKPAAVLFVFVPSVFAEGDPNGEESEKSEELEDYGIAHRKTVEEIAGSGKAKREKATER